MELGIRQWLLGWWLCWWNLTHAFWWALWNCRNTSNSIAHILAGHLNNIHRRENSVLCSYNNIHNRRRFRHSPLLHSLRLRHWFFWLLCWKYQKLKTNRLWWQSHLRSHCCCWQDNRRQWVLQHQALHRLRQNQPRCHNIRVNLNRRYLHNTSQADLFPCTKSIGSQWRRLIPCFYLNQEP